MTRWLTTAIVCGMPLVGQTGADLIKGESTTGQGPKQIENSLVKLLGRHCIAHGDLSGHTARM